MTKLSRLLAALTVISATAVAAAAEKNTKLNVLMIAVDDLRPTFGCYGHPEIKTPHLDALAAEGTVFERAYVAQALCSPSRTALLTGRRPDTTRVYDLSLHFRKTLPDIVALPQHFKQHGYHTQSFGKVYHGSLDDPLSWSERIETPASDEKQKALGKKNKSNKKQSKQTAANRVLERDPKTGAALKVEHIKPDERGPAWEAPDVNDDDLGDGLTASKAVELLGEIKDRPFFLAVGFVRPHLPFVAPKKYFDLYPAASIALPNNPFPTKNMTKYSSGNMGELRSYDGMPKTGRMTDEQTRELRRGYYASASYVDAQIGRVLDELKRLDLDRRTVVVMWGDHGWKLGEHGDWCKHTNFEIDTRAPLIFRVPGQAHPGSKTRALAEFVDVYPTLSELCGLPKPEGLEGVSLAPVIADPDRPWKRAAFSQYPRQNTMGRSMKTDRYRYTEWQDKKTGRVEARELYDHRTDPDENENIADAAENRSLVDELSAQLKAGWRAALPE